MNLTTFKLCYVPEDQILLTQLPDFFESTPYIRDIHLCDSIPNSSNASAERVVSLPHLKDLSVIAQRTPSILLNHLSIPAGASIYLGFTFSGGESPILSYLPKSLDNLKNLSHLTAANPRFSSDKRSLQLNVQSGGLHTWQSGAW